VQAVKDLIKTRYASLMWDTGLLGAWLRVRPGRHRIVILSYHDLPAERFADHLRVLLRAYRVLTLDECVACLAGERPSPANGVVLTFDDACRPFHDEIHPILHRFDVPATVFVPTASIDAGEPLWFNRLKALIHATDTHRIRVGDVRVRIGRDRQRAYHEAMTILNQRPIDARDAILAELFAREPPPDRVSRTRQQSILDRCRPMTWEQMRPMCGLVAFGAHSATHPNLAIVDRQRAEEEIGRSARRIEAELNAAVRHFAYPFGRSSNRTPDTVDVVRQAGFDCAVTTDRGACSPGDDPYQVPRVVCDGIANGRVLAARLSDLWVCVST